MDSGSHSWHTQWRRKRSNGSSICTLITRISRKLRGALTAPRRLSFPPLIRVVMPWSRSGPCFCKHRPRFSDDPIFVYYAVRSRKHFATQVRASVPDNGTSVVKRDTSFQHGHRESTSSNIYILTT